MITIRISHIRLTGYSLLLINILVFFWTWLRWPIAIPAMCLLLIGTYKLMKNINEDQTVILMSKKILLLICGIMLAWTVFSGLGGALPQKHDLHWRNAIFHDLIEYSWPVCYADGYDSSLTYYIAFWIVPAVVGKIVTFLMNAQAGWLAANVVYALYCTSILCVVLLLIISYFKATSMGRALLVVTVLIFFSGMDIVPIVLHQLGEKSIFIGTHLEWWTNIQYSSNTTQLCWVFNQAIPAWLVTALFLHEQRMNHYAFLGSLLLPYGPFPFVGLLFVMVIEALDEFLNAVRRRQISMFFKQIITMPNVLAVAVILPIYYLYYFSNTAISNNGFRMQMPESYLTFILVEFFIYALLIGGNYFKERLFRLSVIGLFFAPLFALGSGQDFCMRASIPLLFILMIYIIGFLLSNITFSEQHKIQTEIIAIPLIVCLSLGALTPLTEYRESYTQIIQSGSRTTRMADGIGTLQNGNKMVRDNFITLNASESLFYRYLAKNDFLHD